MLDTIAAIATGNSVGAVSIIRISGDRAFEIACAVSDVDLTNAKPYTIHYGNITDNGENVDEVLFNVFRAPHSFTGEDVIEINTHGGTYITRKVLSLVLGHGARLARRGEFTERAFLNGKMDLSQAEGINDLIWAKDELNATSAMHSMKGSVRRILDPIVEDLTQIIAQIEVNIDYPEYDDVEELRDETLLPMTKKLIASLDDMIEKAENAVLVRGGIDTVILGKPNVGKSSLLNALLEEEKAIVTDVAGTTRDLVEGSVRIGNVTLNLIDTAGIHDSEDTIEKMGIERSITALEKAELVILVLDASRETDEEDRKLLDMSKDKDRIIVYNKRDINKEENAITISALNHDIDELKQAIEDKYRDYVETAQSDTLNNERQIGLARNAKHALEDAVREMEVNSEVDLVTIDLQEAWNSLKEITGEAGKENLLDEIFSRFCLGK